MEMEMKMKISRGKKKLTIMTLRSNVFIPFELICEFCKIELEISAFLFSYEKITSHHVVPMNGEMRVQLRHRRARANRERTLRSEGYAECHAI